MRLFQKVLEITHTCKHVFGRSFEVHYQYVRCKTKKWRSLKNVYEKSTQLWRAIFPTPGSLDGAKSEVELNIMSLMHVPNFIEIGLLVNKWPNYFHKFCDLSHCAQIYPTDPICIYGTAINIEESESLVVIVIRIQYDVS